MEKHSKIYIAGHKGLVGSALLRNLVSRGYSNLVVREHSQLELQDSYAVRDFFESEHPEYVFLAAAKVGGIMVNNTFRGQFIYENLQIQNNIIHYAYLSGVKKLLFLGSSCIYPRLAPQPLKEDCLLTGELEYTNEPYAIAKIAGIKMCESYNLQYGTDFVSVMPTNLYGYNDNYNLYTSHVLPAMVRKMHLAACLDRNDMDAVRHDLDKYPISCTSSVSTDKEIMQFMETQGIRRNVDGKVELILWGSGTPLREFLWSDDMADACVYIMESINNSDLIPAGCKEFRNMHINIGTGEEITIRGLAELIQSIVGFTGILKFDASKPDGTPRKLLDVSKLRKLGWEYRVELEEGIRMVYQNYTSA